MTIESFGQFQLFQTLLEVRLQPVVIIILHGEGIESDVHVHREEKGSDLFGLGIGKKSDAKGVGSALIVVARLELIRVAEQSKEPFHGANRLIPRRRNEELAIVGGEQAVLIGQGVAAKELTCEEKGVKGRKKRRVTNRWSTTASRSARR